MEKEGTLSLNSTGRIIRFSSILKEMLGFTPEDVLGRDFSSLAPAGMEQEYKTLVETAGRAGPVVGHKTRLLRKAGGAVDAFVSVYPLRDRAGRLDSFMLTLGMEKKIGLPGLLTEEFQRIFRFSNDAVTVTDTDGNIIDVNRSFLDTYGYKKEEVLGKNPRILKSEHSTKKMYEKMWADLLDPSIGFWRGEIINHTKHGVEVPMLLSINAIKDPDGEIRNFLGIAFNMTKQKELDRANRFYIDYILHDIKGPLMTVAINAERVLGEAGGAVPEKSRKRLAAIIDSSRRVENMAVDVLNFSRAQSGSLPLDKRKVSISMVLKAAIEPFEGTGKRIFVNDEVYPGGIDDKAEIEADPEKLGRIVYNLLSNAVKHSRSEVSLSYCFHNRWFEFAVSDDGRGISSEEAGRIFDAFYQTEDGIKTGGAGLGLSIVKTFVEAHGGQVWVKPGKGATFGFFIPVKEEWGMKKIVKDVPEEGRTEGPGHREDQQ